MTKFEEFKDNLIMQVQNEVARKNGFVDDNGWHWTKATNELQPKMVWNLYKQALELLDTIHMNFIIKSNGYKPKNIMDGIKHEIDMMPSVKIDTSKL